jgi:outer membrane receptor protein involved in Fe transport
MRDVSSWTTVRLSAGYSFENMDIDFVIENLFDRGAPLAFGSARGFDSINHDPFGTGYRLSVRYFFD